MGEDGAGGPVARSYRDLLVWQKAKAFAVQIYGITQQFPKCECYGLTSQLRRAAVSVFSNIAEGQGRLTTGEFLQFLGQARGSLLEVDAELSIAFDLGYLDKGAYDRLEGEAYQVLGSAEPIDRVPACIRASRGFETLKP